MAGNVSLTSFKRSGISLYEGFRKFLAEAQRSVYADVMEIHSVKPPRTPPLSWVMDSVKFSSLNTLLAFKGDHKVTNQRSVCRVSIRCPT